MERSFNVRSLVGKAVAAALFPAVTCLFGCSAEIGDGSEAIGSTEQAIEGSYAGPFSNGAWGNDPVGAPDGSKFCEAFDGRDQRWHPGKLWSTSCRYEYGGAVTKKTSGYKVLQGPSNYRFVSSMPYEQDLVTGSTPGTLPVCLSNTTNSPGKVWAGKCRFEWGDDALATTNFKWVEHVVIIPPP